MPEELDLDVSDASDKVAPSSDDEVIPSSPQRRTIGDFQSKKALERLRDRLGDASGEYHDDAPGKGPSFFTEPMGPMGHFIVVSFKNDRTRMQMNAKNKDEMVLTFMEKVVDGYNVDSAIRFIKQAKRIIEEIHAMY